MTKISKNLKKLKRVAVDNSDRIYAGDFQIYDRVVYKVGRQREKSKMQKKNDKKINPCYLKFRNVNLCSNT